MTDEQRCATCRFWSRYATKDDILYYADRGYCELSCMTGAQRSAAGVEFVPRMFCSERGCLDTEAEFGCVHWEATP